MLGDECVCYYVGLVVAHICDIVLAYQFGWCWEVSVFIIYRSSCHYRGDRVLPCWSDC